MPAIIAIPPPPPIKAFPGMFSSTANAKNRFFSNSGTIRVGRFSTRKLIRRSGGITSRASISSAVRRRFNHIKNAPSTRNGRNLPTLKLIVSAISVQTYTTNTPLGPSMVINTSPTSMPGKNGVDIKTTYRITNTINVEKNYE